MQDRPTGGPWSCEAGRRLRTERLQASRSINRPILARARWGAVIGTRLSEHACGSHNRLAQPMPMLAGRTAAKLPRRRVHPRATVRQTEARCGMEKNGRVPPITAGLRPAPRERAHGRICRLAFEDVAW